MNLGPVPLTNIQLLRQALCDLLLKFEMYKSPEATIEIQIIKEALLKTI